MGIHVPGILLEILYSFNLQNNLGIREAALPSTIDNVVKVQRG